MDAFADLFIYLHLVEPRRQRLNRLHGRSDFAVLFLGD